MAVNPLYSGGIKPENFNVKINEQYDLIEKVARQVLNEVDVTDRLKVFDKMPIDNGTTLEEYTVQLARSTAYDPEDTNPFDITKPELVVRYYRDWTPKKFRTTVYDNEIRKILLADGNVSKVSASIVSSLTKGDIYEKYLNVRDMLQYGVDNDLITKFKTLDKTDYKGILKAIKNCVSGMGFANANFNKAGIVRETPSSRLYILMPFEIKNALDVDELAGVFNLDKAELKSRIIEIDKGDNIYIVDEMAILSYTRLYDMRSIINPDGLYANYILHTDRLYALSSLFDMAVIQLGSEIEYETTENGTVSGVDFAVTGSEVELTVEANEGFQVSKVMVNGVEVVEDEGYKFTMPPEKAIITAEFIEE